MADDLLIVENDYIFRDSLEQVAVSCSLDFFSGNNETLNHL